MPWELNFNHNYKDTSECCLQLLHADKNHAFRSWFGPLAKHILSQLQPQLRNWFSREALNEDSRIHSYKIDKQLAQFTLMQASFHHQRCIYQFQVYDDLKKHELTGCHELAEFLLFIRMTPQHPTQNALIQLAEKQMPWCDDIDGIIGQLINAKLIQRICCHEHVFYDKNPFPHDHVLDLDAKKLNDFTFNFPIKDNQKLVISSVL